MQTIESVIKEPCHYDFSNNYVLEQLLFFDIETTGLSADISSLYLIGCIYYKQNNWHLIQWFADEYQEEPLLLQAFFSFASYFSIILHYNGNSFDIPYIEKKCQQFQLDYNFSNFKSIDLYKKFLPFKKILKLPSIKQKKVEELFGLYRNDTYTGKELIQVYGSYLHERILSQKEILSHEKTLPQKNDFKNEIEILEKKKHSLLLHNKEDLTGLLYITSILSFEDLLNKKPEIIDCNHNDIKQKLTLKATLYSPLPIEVHFKKDNWEFFGNKNTGIMTIPVLNNQFKLYYENYKDYFYLPTEDMAIYKSVATFVDKEFRQKATKDNCYTKINISESLLNDKEQLSACFQKLLKHYIF